MDLQPFEYDLEGLLLGLLDGFVLVLAHDGKACGEMSVHDFFDGDRVDLPWGTPG